MKTQFRKKIHGESGWFQCLACTDVVVSSSTFRKKIDRNLIPLMCCRCLLLLSKLCAVLNSDDSAVLVGSLHYNLLHEKILT